MTTVKNNRDKWLHLRLTENELKQINTAFRQTTDPKFSDYARKILLGKPHIGLYRNASLDEAMAALMKLRKDLNGVANNFNQAVHKLHTLDHLPQFQRWLISYELEKQTLFNKIDEVRKNISKMGEIWLQ